MAEAPEHGLDAFLPPPSDARELEPGAPFVLAREEAQEELLAAFHAAWGTEAAAGRNPCPQPVSLERRHLALLRERSYVVADKSDGQRFCLVLTRVGGKEYSLLVDRKLAFYQVPVCAAARCFDGSLFDGELVWTWGADGVAAQTLLLFDVVCWRGDGGAAGREPLGRRLELLRRVFDLGDETVAGADGARACALQGKIVCGGNAHGLAFRPKPCFAFELLPTLARRLRQLPYRTDGLLFTPVDESVRTGTHETLLKLKWHQTLDLWCNPTTQHFYLGGGAGAHEARLDLEACEEALGQRLEPALGFWEALQRALTPRDSPVGCLVEVRLLPRAQREAVRFDFVALRRDKRHPNSVRTATRTLRSLRQAVSLEDLLQVVESRGARGRQ